MGLAYSTLRTLFHRIVWWNTASDEIPLLEDTSDAKQVILAAQNTGANTLDLSNMGLTKTPRFGDISSQLQSLDLSRNRLIDVDVSELRVLKHLTIHDNLLSKLQIPKNLKSIDVSRNPTLLQCPIGSNLSILRADNNEWAMDTVISALKHMTSLHELSLAKNKLKDSFCVPDTVRWLDVTDNDLSNLEIGPDSQMRRMYISHNRFSSLPSLSPHLMVIRASHNEIESIPENIGECNRLQWCAFDHNSITELPSCLGSCPMLKVLSISHNKLDTIPFELRYLVKLQLLDIRHNNLTALFPNLGTGRWAELETLLLSHNKIAHLPDGIGHLVCLKELRIDHNDLDEVPDLVGLERLEVLDASFNRLSTVPESLATLKHLRMLGVERNPLTLDSVPLALVARMSRKNKQRIKILFDPINVEIEPIPTVWDAAEENEEERSSEETSDRGTSELQRLLDVHSDANGIKADINEEDVQAIRQAWASEMTYSGERGYPR